jgi:hypothetical protein
MYISAEVDDDQVVIEALKILYKRVRNEEFEEICRALFKVKNCYVVDWTGLAIASIDNPRYLNVINEAVSTTAGQLRKDLILVRDQSMEANARDIS